MYSYISYCSCHINFHGRQLILPFLNAGMWSFACIIPTDSLITNPRSAKTTYISRKQIVQYSTLFCKVFVTDLPMVLKQTSQLFVVQWLTFTVLWCLQEDHVLALACRFDGRSMKALKQSMITATFVLNDAWKHPGFFSFLLPSVHYNFRHSVERDVFIPTRALGTA